MRYFAYKNCLRNLCTREDSKNIHNYKDKFKQNLFILIKMNFTKSFYIHKLYIY